MTKKWFRATAIVLAALFALYALAVWAIDPYLLYHEPWFGLKPQRSDDSRYENYGLARFLDYDAVMLGTSVTQDAKASEFNALFGCNALRVKFAGSYFKELGDFLKFTYAHHEGNIDTVFMVLDLTHLLTDVNRVGHTDNPEYLYDDNFLNDSSYLLNKDVAPDLIRSVLDLSPVDFDYQVWNDPTGYDTLIRTYGPNRPAQEESKEFTPELRALVLENYETNVISIAREHPETQFYFAFPPGNMFFWDYVNRYGEFEQYLAAMETVIGEMLPLENVRVFQFVDDAGKTEDLDRYKDRVHFDPAMMSEIISDVAAGRHEVTADTLESTMQSVRDHWQNRDYDALYAGYTAE